MSYSCFFISFLIVYYLDKHVTQRMCDEFVDDYIASLNLFPIGLLQIKLLKNFIYCFVHR